MNKRNIIGIYKANQKQSGSVAQFKISDRKDCMYLEMAKQYAQMDSSKPYDWDNKIVIKLGSTDITKFLAYFEPQITYYRSVPKPLKLFHKTDKTSKGIELKWQEREYKGEKTYSYYLTVRDNTYSKSISVPISLDEVEYLKVGFKRALELILGWN